MIIPNYRLGSELSKRHTGADRCRLEVCERTAGVTRNRHLLRVTTSAGRDRRATPLFAWVRVGEGALAPAEAIAAELRTASAPDLAMLVVAAAGCVRRWGEKDVPL